MPSPPALAIVVERVTQTHAVAGAVHCPRCGFRLGLASSLAIGYLRRCSACQRPIAIRIRGDRLFIAIEELPRLSGDASS